ncbi:hypothetical protein GCM10025868_25710 [Angustibacter aerolatus]|uniref:Uncharacterized protein n=1 Tax=Angustibacter aerolatus TaxID=1162965 RepID=A0ABQ6JKK0_9ACTN|nr:hypothetical protein GCM10025868_25710 [Angustibacter aerolatus]
MADVDDTFALSAKVGNTTDLSRRVRWVHDAACVPVIRALRLPAGTLTGQARGRRARRDHRRREGRGHRDDRPQAC